MVTASKKPKAAPAKEIRPKPAVKKAAAPKPKAAAKKTTATKPKTATTPKKSVTKKTTATKKPAASKPQAKPKTTVVKAKTAKMTSAPAKAMDARKVGEMVYNDELFESLAETVLLAEAEMEGLLPEVKGQLFDYDIYLVSFLDDDEIGEIAEYLAGDGKSAVSADALKPKLLAIRDNARIFVALAAEFNSVRAFIDSMIKADDRDGLSEKFNGNLKGVHPETFESFILLF